MTAENIKKSRQKIKQRHRGVLGSKRTTCTVTVGTTVRRNTVSCAAGSATDPRTHSIPSTTTNTRWYRKVTASLRSHRDPNQHLEIRVSEKTRYNQTSRYHSLNRVTMNRLGKNRTIRQKALRMI